MSAHFTEDEFLEIHYLERRHEPAVAAHLATCGACAEELKATEERLRLASPRIEPDDAFFERQRAAVIARVRAAPARDARPWKIAAAAALVLSMSGLVAYRAGAPAQSPATTTGVTVTAATAPTPEPLMPRDVWDTDALNELHPLVDWESWEESTSTNGGRS